MGSALPLATCSAPKDAEWHPPGLAGATPPNNQSPITPIQPDVPFLSALDGEKTQDPKGVADATQPGRSPKQHHLLRLHAVARAVKTVTRPLAFLSAVYTLATMALVLSTFTRTVDVQRTLYLPPVPVTRGPWHAKTETWPTYLLLATSVLTCVTSTTVAAVSWYNAKFLASASARFSGLVYLLIGGHFLIWVGTAAAYHRAKTGTDLWGWSCTSKAQRVLQPFFQDQVDFRMLCAIQTSSWAISLVQVAMTAISFSLLWVLNRCLQQQPLLNEGQTRGLILPSYPVRSPRAFKGMLEYSKDLVGVAT